MVYMFIEKFTNPKYISLVAVLFLMIIAIGCESGINGIDDVIEAFKDNAKDQHIIRFASGTVECLDKAGSDSANAEILSTYGIPVDRRL